MKAIVLTILGAATAAFTADQLRRMPETYEGVVRDTARRALSKAMAQQFEPLEPVVDQAAPGAGHGFRRLAAGTAVIAGRDAAPRKPGLAGRFCNDRGD